MDLSFLDALGVNSAKADDVIRRTVVSLRASGDNKDNFQQESIQLIQELWAAEAMHHGSVNETVQIIECIVKALFGNQVLPAVSWSSIAQEAEMSFAKKGNRLKRRADRRNNGNTQEQQKKRNTLSDAAVAHDSWINASATLDPDTSQVPCACDKMAALRVPQGDVEKALQALGKMKPCWKSLMLRMTGAIRMRKGVHTPDDDPDGVFRLIVLPPPLDQQVAAAMHASAAMKVPREAGESEDMAAEKTTGKRNGHGFISGPASSSLPPELFALLERGVAVFEPSIELPSFHTCPPADPRLAELGALPLPAHEDTAQDSSRFGNHQDGIHCCGSLRPFRFIELFSGIGGFRVALDALGGQCVFASDVHPTARAVYRENWPRKLDGGKNDILSGDIRLVPAEAVPEHDILTAGFPCQPFTGLGKQRGVNEPKGQLFLHICRILRTRRPPLALLENVTGLTNTDDGCAMQAVLDEIRSSGYRVAYRVYDSRYLVPQKRKRVYIVAIRADLEDVCNKFRFPWVPDLGRSLGEALERPLPSGEAERLVLSEDQWSRIAASQPFRDNPNNILARLDLPANTLISSYGECKTSSRFCRLSQLVHRCECHQDRFAAADSPPRYFSSRECARIQGFPETFLYSACDGPYSWYRLIGNAVSPPIVCALAGALLCALRHQGQQCTMPGTACAVRLALGSGTEEARSRLLELDVEGPGSLGQIKLRTLLDSLEG
ncbi:unnamed protein product [Prorocentrum cordatum]|uniref:DNA (cytosine-5-)-methyltransferase n=1 Tax=Prorocentrum cordatum TaxID=2364126 RepID=A0ABN9SMC9_9DINO|nr:unnamed protein product [Polarella glacialis]